MTESTVCSEVCFVCGDAVPFADRELTLAELMQLQQLAPPERIHWAANLLSSRESEAQIWLGHRFAGGCQEPAADCPFCGERLRTPRAKQCASCLTQWHDSKSISRLSAV